MNERERFSFSERYARRMAAGMVAMALMAAVATFGPAPSRALLYAVIGVLACMYWLRAGQMYDEQRRNEVMEDERDRYIQLRAAHWSRVVLMVCVGTIAVALSIPAFKQGLSTGELFLPGLLVLAMIAANGTGHAVVIAAYRQDRR